MFRPRWVTAFIAIAAVFVLMTADAHARAGGGFSGGSRGMRTFSAPPSTPTAPTAAPIQNSMTQPGGAASIGQAGARPGLFGGRGLFGGGLFGGIAAGFLGAGLFGLLFGQGFFGGMAGFASIIGLLLQVVLVVIVARLIFAWWQRRNMSAPAYAAARPATGRNFGGLGAFFRRFASATGMTPIEYCRAVRIARARELLEFGNTPQKEIAHSLGYKDVASFARVFRRALGLAPGAYRKRFGDSDNLPMDSTRRMAHAGSGTYSRPPLETGEDLSADHDLTDLALR